MNLHYELGSGSHSDFVTSNNMHFIQHPLAHGFYKVKDLLERR